MEAFNLTVENRFPSSAHPAWRPLLDELKHAGLARDLDVARLSRLLELAPTPTALAHLLAAHYHAGGDSVERAWRSQGDHFLELPDEALAPETLAAAAQMILPEERIGVVRTAAGVEVRMACDDQALLDTDVRVFLRRMATHARRGLVRAEAIQGLLGRSFVYALNVLLAKRNSDLRFIPILAVAGRGAWVATTLDRALQLEDLGVIAPGESWREFARYTELLSMAS